MSQPTVVSSAVMHRSVPLRIGVVGAGRVGAVLGSAWRSAGHEITAVSGESDASRRRAATLLPGVAVAKPSAVARSCDVLVLAVPDDMLGNVVNQLGASGALDRGGAARGAEARAGAAVADAPLTVVHLSGRHGLAVLDAALDAGAEAVALHPAMTFTGTARDLSRLEGCAFGATTASEASAALVEDLVGAVGGRVVPVLEEHRSRYHAALAHGANHLVTLVAQAREMLAAVGAEDPAATLRPLLWAALENALESGDAALTGPIVRGDVETVRAHVLDLIDHHPLAVASYVALARDTASRATADGRLLAIRAAALERVLALAEAGRRDTLADRGTPPTPGTPGAPGAPGTPKSRRSAAAARRAERGR